MGGGSSSKSSTSSKTTYSKTTTSNPYVTSVTDNNGTTTTLKDGTAYKSIYDYMNKNMDSLLEEYRNPNINSATNQALLQNYTRTLNEESRKALENSIINPLAERNMLRSSAATNLYSDYSKLIEKALLSYFYEGIFKPLYEIVQIPLKAKNTEDDLITEALLKGHIVYEQNGFKAIDRFTNAQSTLLRKWGKQW